MVGCAGMIAAVAFVFGMIGSLFATEANFGERIMIAFMPAAFAFVAALILCARDYARRTSTMRTLRQMLLARHDVNDDDFVSHFPDADPALVTQTRQAISQFFDVPVQKIHPTDKLQDDLRFDRLEPGFHLYVVHHVLDARKVAPRPFTFHTGGLTGVGDLAKEIQCVLDRFENAERDDGALQ